MTIVEAEVRAGPVDSVMAPSDLDAFCRAEYGRVVGTLSLYVGNHATAAELAQDTFVRVCRDWQQVARMENPGAWTHRVAINLANSWYRRRRAESRANQRSHERDVHHGPEPDVGPVVREALAALDPGDRAVLVLRYYADLSVAQVADALGLPEGTVKTNTRRAISRLRTSGLVLEEEDL